MLKKTLLTLAAAISVAGSANAQTLGCGTDEVMRQARMAHPEIAEYEAQMEAQIKEGLKHIDLSKYAAKGTGFHSGIQESTPPVSPRDLSTDVYHIPIVVHITHDYGAENLTDDVIFEALKQWNIVYAKQNADTADVILPFKKYIGNPRIVLHLANRDPLGNPTKGITRHRSYLTMNGGDQAKYDGWPNSSYINIWFVNQMPTHQNAAAYAMYPSAAQAPSEAPYDGVISLFDYITTNKTINHEIGHVLNLKHVWGDTNDPEVGCGDDDVDDTPPTKGHKSCGSAAGQALWDTACSNGYTKNYLIHDTEVVNINYPDTNNTQNIMDYSYCAKMFTHGQVLRMHRALNSDVANRDHLWSQLNLVATGLITDTLQNPDGGVLPRIDVNPVPDFSVEKGKSAGLPPAERTYFYCANDVAVKFAFKNQSWNDTITSVKYHFSNGAGTTDTTLTGAGLSASVYNTFTQPGWVTIDMTAYGNGNTSASTTRQAVYAADGANPIAVDPNGAPYYMDFNPGQTDNWPIFNYYNNEFKWEINHNTGFFDQTCISYRGYDTRPFPMNGTGAPGGDFDDFFTPAFDLSAMSSGHCNLNFVSAGAFRTGNPGDMKDSLIVSYSVDCGKTWQVLKNINKHELANAGTTTGPYQPHVLSDWALHSLAIPDAARTNKTFFRFRYRPGMDNGFNSTGNNFYLDRINIGSAPLGVNTLVNGNHAIALAPNPTTGSSYVIINGQDNSNANVIVTDVTGRVVFNTTQKMAGNIDRIEIPASVLQVKGMYMVHVKTDSQTYTDKLVAY